MIRVQSECGGEVVEGLFRPGSKRTRDPERLRPGDYVDSWQVVAMEPPGRLTLGYGMRAPGSGVLEFEVEVRE